MSEPITIVIIRALGMAGATWFNLVLGNHPDAMPMGPVDRILDLPPGEADRACFIHRERCDFWPKFVRAGGHRGRFFKDLAAYTGKRFFICNYPRSEMSAREVDGQGFRVLHIRLVRDARAALYSYLRHHGTLTPGAGIYHIIDRQAPKWDTVDRKMPDDPAITMVVRYEDMVTNTQAELARIGEFIGLRYDAGAVRFWERPLHLTAGNTGVLDLICRLQGETGHIHGRAEVYSQLADELQVNPEQQYLDESWKEGLSRADRLAFDCLLGERNARFGYPRDRFSGDETEDFWRNLDRHIGEARRIEEAAKRKAARAARPTIRGRLGRMFPFLATR